MKDETRQEISAAFAKDYTDWMVKTGGYAKDMTLRDHLAGLAMQGMLANSKLEKQIVKGGGAFGGWIEESSYSWADAMLKERSK